MADQYGLCLSAATGGPLPVPDEAWRMAIDGFAREDQALYLVMGGRVADPQGTRFVDPASLDVRGVFGCYDDAFAIWRAVAQASVDDATMKYVLVRLR